MVRQLLNGSDHGQMLFCLCNSCSAYLRWQIFQVLLMCMPHHRVQRKMFLHIQLIFRVANNLPCHISNSNCGEGLHSVQWLYYQ